MNHISTREQIKQATCARYCKEPLGKEGVDIFQYQHSGRYRNGTSCKVSDFDYHTGVYLLVMILKLEFSIPPGFYVQSYDS